MKIDRGVVQFHSYSIQYKHTHKRGVRAPLLESNIVAIITIVGIVDTRIDPVEVEVEVKAEVVGAIVIS